MLKNKCLLITGGTGSFGNAVLERFLTTDIGEIRIFSRDEKKQDDMRHLYQAQLPRYSNKIKFYIGDVRDRDTLRPAMYGADYVFHAAALKQVPSCEFFPMEAVKTNIIGTDNMLTVAIQEGIKRVVCLSTDKAAYPVNAMGTSKAMMEKIIIAKSRNFDQKKIKICCTRYGNVMCSRGSVIPLFIEQIKCGQDITVTDPEMTRFIMSLNDAVELVDFAFDHAQNGDIMIQKAPSCYIGDLATAIKEIFNASNKVDIIGARHGEKKYEVLMTKEEAAKAIDENCFYRIPADNRDLNYDNYLTNGSHKISKAEEYDSNNTHILTIDEIKTKLLELEYVKKELNNWRS